MARSAALAEAVTELAGIAETGDRLMVLGGVVLPGVAEVVEALVATLSPVADATCLRTLPPLATDLRSDAASLVTCARALGVGSDPGVGARFGAQVAAAGGW